MSHITVTDNLTRETVTSPTDSLSANLAHWFNDGDTQTLGMVNTLAGAYADVNDPSIPSRFRRESATTVEHIAAALDIKVTW